MKESFYFLGIWFLIVAFFGKSVQVNANPKIIAEPTCPPTGTITFPDPESCASYYLCTEGNLNHFTCPDGTYWNQDAGICDFPENVECSLWSTTTVGPVPGTNTPPPDPEPECPTQDGVFLIPYPGNCSLYFICFDNGNGHSVESCADGTLFDPNDRICKPADEVENCEPSPTNQPPTQMTTTRKTTLPPGEFYCPEDVEFIYMPHPASCSMFYWCEYGEYKGESKCGVGLWFDFEWQACVDPYESSCVLEPKPSTVLP